MSTSLSYSLLHHHIVSRLGFKKISGSPMAKLSQGTDGVNQMREATGKEACDSSRKRRVSDGIIPHILNLYGSSATARDFEIYAPNASFEDPLMCAHGVKQIKSAFYSLSKVFSESRIVEYSVEENEISPGKQEILMDNKQYYKFLGKDIDLISRITLYVEEGRVVRHEDCLSSFCLTTPSRDASEPPLARTVRWDRKPIWNRETVQLPLLGRAAEITRRGAMLATHALMRFGKDPTN